MSIVERITDQTDPSLTRGHRFRYHLAAGFLTPGDNVLDAACGSGYGEEILSQACDIQYVGVDRDLSETPERMSGAFLRADLMYWWPLVDVFDVFVGFETIEHLESYDHYVELAKATRKWIIVSCPVVPTRHTNPFHLHDFAPGELVGVFEDDDWELFQLLMQPEEWSEIYVFRHR